MTTETTRQRLAGSDETRTPLKLLSSRQEAGNVKTFLFETGGIKWIAGQLQNYILPQAGETEAENLRWFTIASAPFEGTINISTRVSDSSFKQCLNAMEPGDEILAYNLHGEFTWQEVSEDRVVMVAGGIGITPFRSILLDRKASGKRLNATLLYYNRTDDVPFRSEFERLLKDHPEFGLRIIVGQPITGKSIVDLAPGTQKSLVYISGAKPMMQALGTDLKGRGIRMKQDWFPGYDGSNY